MSRLVIAIIVVVIVVIVITLSYWYWDYTYNHPVSSVSDLRDGATVAIPCNLGYKFDVVSATYTRPDGTKADVTSKLHGVPNLLTDFALRTNSANFTVNSAALGQPSGGSLSFQYQCVAQPTSTTKSNFLPIQISPCAGGECSDGDYSGDGNPSLRGAQTVRTSGFGQGNVEASAGDPTSRNAAGTVVRTPWSTQSRVSLQRNAESPENATQANPVTGIGKTSMVRRLGDRYRRKAELMSLSAYDIQPGHGGYMRPIEDGITKVSLSVHSTDSPNSVRTGIPMHYPPPARSAPTCSLAGSDADTNFYTDGFYGDAVLSAKGVPRATPLGATSGAESFTSTRPEFANTLTGEGVGLGRVPDPRFEPGAGEWYGTASWSAGDWAGGPTTGALMPVEFAPAPNWDTNYVAGFDDDV